jgi:hypothetical protein
MLRSLSIGLMMVITSIAILFMAPIEAPAYGAQQLPTLTPVLCANTLPSRLSGEYSASVITDKLPIYSHPSYKSKKMGFVPLYKEVDFALSSVDTKPTCAEGTTWWPIDVDNGWVSEADNQQYNLAPIQITVKLPPETATPGATQFSYNGISFTRNDAVFGTPVQINTNAPILNHGSGHLDTPGGTQIVLQLPSKIQTFITVYPAKNTPLVQDIATHVAEIKLLTKNQTKLAAEVRPVSGAGRFALIPYPKITPLFNAQYKYLAFQNGIAIRFANSLQWLGDVENFQYYVEGVTNDGDYFFTVLVPLDFTGDLPSSPQEFSCGFPCKSDPPQFRDWTRQVATTIDNAAPTSFIPTLTNLDSFVNSIEINKPPAP